MQTGNITISTVNMKDRQDIGIKSGDTVRVWQKVQEKGKTRLQPFEGIVLARKHGSTPGATFTVRRVSGGYGVEKIFPLYSPAIDKIEIIKRAKVRRAKLYHIREKAAKEIKRQMRNMRFVDISTVSDTEEKTKDQKSDDDASTDEEKKSKNKEKPKEVSGGAKQDKEETGKENAKAKKGDVPDGQKSSPKEENDN